MFSVQKQMYFAFIAMLHFLDFDKIKMKIKKNVSEDR
jgi:hypothetical protein